MSKDTFLETLLDGAEVEWVALGEICKPKRGKRLVKKQLQKTGSYAVYQNSMKPLGYYEESNVTAGTLFIVCAGAAGEIGYSIEPFWAADDVYYFESNELLNSKFLYHYLLTQRFKILSRVRRASIPRLSKESFDKIQIPIPCPENPEKSLAIQAKIVRILDTFTELTAELTARKKQYNYYRDQLLTFEEGEVELVPLANDHFFEIANRGRRPVKASLRIPGETPYYGANNVQDYVEGHTHDGEFVLIAEDGSASLEKYSIQYAVGMFWANNHVHVVAGKEGVNTRYLYHLLCTLNFIPYLSGGGRAKLTKGKLSEIPIPIPPLPEQARIVAILDKFDTLAHSISEGLPREIELRQKQYEYYRDLLLNFPKSEPQTEIVA